MGHGVIPPAQMFIRQRGLKKIDGHTPGHILRSEILHLILHCGKVALLRNGNNKNTELIGAFTELGLNLVETQVGGIGGSIASSNIHSGVGRAGLIPDLGLHRLGEQTVLLEQFITGILILQKVFAHIEDIRISGVRNLKTLVAIAHAIKPQHTDLLKIVQIAIQISLGQLSGETLIQCALGSRHLALRSLTVEVAYIARGHDSNQQHGRLENVHMILIGNILSLSHVMLISALCLGGETTHVALAGEEIIPQEIRGEPSPVVRAKVVDVIQESNILFLLLGVFHKAEQCALRSAKVLRHNGKQGQRHRVQRA